jgi:hypothetical protein
MWDRPPRPVTGIDLFFCLLFIRRKELQGQLATAFLECVYPCTTGGLPGGAARCIETSQRLSGVAWVDNYTAETIARPLRGRQVGVWGGGGEMTPQGVDGLGPKWFPQTVADWNRHGNCTTKDGQKRNFEGMNWTSGEGNKKKYPLIKKKGSKIQARCIHKQDPYWSLQYVQKIIYFIFSFMVPTISYSHLIA